MYNQANKAYQQNSVQTAGPGQLIVMLYDGAIRFTRAGIDGIQRRDYVAANMNLKKSQSIVHELIASLNPEVPISRDLARIYEYMLYCLIQSNVRKDAKLAEEVLAHLQDLRESWKQILKSNLTQVATVQGHV